MFVKNADVQFQTVVYFVRNTHGGEDVEGKVLSLAAVNTGVAVDPTEAEATGNVGNQTPIGPDEVVTHAGVETEVMIFDSAENRLRRRGHVKLIVTAQPTVVVDLAPAHPRG